MKTLADLTVPATAKGLPLLEAQVQEKCVAWARARIPPYWARKFSSISQRSVPDYLFAGQGLKFATEFKREGCPLRQDTGMMSTPAQCEEQQKMRDAGWEVFECSSFDAFRIKVIELECAAWL